MPSWYHFVEYKPHHAEAFQGKRFGLKDYTSSQHCSSLRFFWIVYNIHIIRTKKIKSSFWCMDNSIVILKYQDTTVQYTCLWKQATLKKNWNSTLHPSCHLLPPHLYVLGNKLQSTPWLKHPSERTSNKVAVLFLGRAISIENDPGNLN